MKTIINSPLAALLSVVIVISAVSIPAATTTIPMPARQVRILGIPAPSQMMRISEGAPFTVPVGKMFVATGVGFVDLTTTSGRFGINFNGVRVLSIRSTAVETSLGVAGIPPGLVAQEGTIVDVLQTTSGSPAVLLGYLAQS